MEKEQHFNKRKNAIELLKREMVKEGYEFKKAVKNTVIFHNQTTGKKVRKTLTY